MFAAIAANSLPPPWAPRTISELPVAGRRSRSKSAAPTMPRVDRLMIAFRNLVIEPVLNAHDAAAAAVALRSRQGIAAALVREALEDVGPVLGDTEFTRQFIEFADDLAHTASSRVPQRDAENVAAIASTAPAVLCVLAARGVSVVQYADQLVARLDDPQVRDVFLTAVPMAETSETLLIILSDLLGRETLPRPAVVSWVCRRARHAARDHMRKAIRLLHLVYPDLTVDFVEDAIDGWPGKLACKM